MGVLNGKDGKVDEKPSYLKDKAAKYVIGTNRGPLAASSGDQGSEVLDVRHVETADDASTGTQEKKKMQKVKRHFRRFWFCYLLLSIILAAILLPILFVFIIPAIAQRVLSNSKLVLTSAQIMQPRPDSVMLTMLSVLDLSGFTVQMDPMTLDLFVRQLNDRPFAHLYLPATKVHGNTTLGVVNQPTPLIYMEGWQTFVDNAVYLNKGPVSLKGTSTIHMGKLHAKVTLDKDVPSNALNKFEGFSIQDSRLLLPPDSDGTNLVGNATLPNPSIMTLEIGNTTLNVLSGDLVIGNVTINDLTIRPGNHSTPIRGYLDLKKIIKNLPEILQTQREAIKNGYLELNTIGTSVTYEGVTVPYYEKVLKNLTLTAQVPIMGILVNTINGITHSNASHLLSSLNLTDSLGDNGGASNLLGSLNHTRLVEKLIDDYGDL